jgi:hypothetical protein
MKSPLSFYAKTAACRPLRLSGIAKPSTSFTYGLQLPKQSYLHQLRHFGDTAEQPRMRLPFDVFG